jgi:hypothetical protein
MAAAQLRVFRAGGQGGVPELEKGLAQQHGLGELRDKSAQN